MDTYRYIRVSTKEQNEDRQMIAIREFCIENGHIILDKQSGKYFDRPGYRQLIRRLKAGDTLVIKSIDRLGGNCNEILEQWRSYVAQTEQQPKELGVAHGTFQRWRKVEFGQ